MPTPKEVIRAYRRLRDMKSEIEARHKEELGPVREKMAKFEAWLQRHMAETGAESIKTDDGTAYITKTASVKINDWSTALQYVMDNQLYHMLEQRLSKSQVEEFVEEEQSNFPGTEITYTTNIRVRK